MKRLTFVLIFLGFISCGGGDDEGQDFGDITSDDPSGLIVTRDEHPDGWGRDDCIACHPLEDIHQEDRTGGAFPIEDVRDFVATEGPDSCFICHGSNGVE